MTIIIKTIKKSGNGSIDQKETVYIDYGILTYNRMLYSSENEWTIPIGTQ